MKARLALVAALALPLGLSALPTAVEYLPGTISLNPGVKLGDKVLPAGSYDVQIHYKGFGNTAEIQFFQNRVFKGKTNAEARGFPSTAPAGVSGGGTLDHKTADPYLKYEGKQDLKLDANKDWGSAGGSQAGYKEQKADYKEQKADKIAGAPQAPSFWGAHGFAPSATGQAVQTGGSVKLTFNSSNSSAAFSANLPVAKK